jgi:hypothetical protein
MRKLVFILIWAVVAVLLAAFLSGFVTFCMALLGIGDLKADAAFTIILGSTTVLCLGAIVLGFFGLLPGTRSQHSEHK